jgi:hypothetical protein
MKNFCEFQINPARVDDIVNSSHKHAQNFSSLEQWYSTFFVRVPPDIISLQLCTPEVVGL